MVSGLRRHRARGGIPRALHDRLYTRSLRHHLRPEFPYAPHVTIARHRDFDALQAAVAEAEDAFGGEYADVMRSVDLLAVGPDGRIERLASIPLDSA